MEPRGVSAESSDREIRVLFEAHSLLLFRGQPLDDEEHLAFARLFGRLEDRQARPAPTRSTATPGARAT